MEEETSSSIIESGYTLLLVQCDVISKDLSVGASSVSERGAGKQN